MALTIPDVTVWPTPNGSPMANTMSPISTLLESASVSSRKVRSIDLEHGDVGARIGAHYASLHLSLVMQRHGNFLGAFHHVIVRQNVAFGADDDARSESFLAALLRNIESLPEVISEELAEERIDTLRAFPCAVCFTTFEDEMLTTAGRTRFTRPSTRARKRPRSARPFRWSAPDSQRATCLMSAARNP